MPGATAPRIPLARAEDIASRLMRAFDPAVERIEIGGSIRRMRAHVKDIELVVVPKYEERPAEGVQARLDDPAPAVRVNLLRELIEAHPDAITPIKSGTHEIVPWPLRDEGKYWRLWLPRSAIKVDVFIVTPANWGWGLLIRTVDPATREVANPDGLLNLSRQRSEPAPPDADVRLLRPLPAMHCRRARARDERGGTIRIRGRARRSRRPLLRRLVRDRNPRAANCYAGRLSAMLARPGRETAPDQTGRPRHRRHLYRPRDRVQHFGRAVADVLALMRITYENAIAEAR